MTNLMASKLGRKWWFSGLIGFFSAFLTLPILQAAGLQSPENWAQWLVYFLCFGGIWRFLGFAGWLAVLLIKPTSTLLDPAKR